MRISSQLLMPIVYQAVLIALYCLSLARAARRAPQHLSWLVPTVIGWGAFLLNGLCSLAFIAFPSYDGPEPFLLKAGRWLHTLGMTGLIWGAISLYRHLVSVAPQQRLPTPGE